MWLFVSGQRLKPSAFNQLNEEPAHSACDWPVWLIYCALSCEDARVREEDRQGAPGEIGVPDWLCCCFVLGSFPLITGHQEVIMSGTAWDTVFLLLIHKSHAASYSPIHSKNSLEHLRWHNLCPPASCLKQGYGPWWHCRSKMGLMMSSKLVACCVAASFWGPFVFAYEDFLVTYVSRAFCQLVTGGPPCVSSSKFTGFFARNFRALFGGGDKDEMSWVHFGSRWYRFELSSMLFLSRAACRERQNQLCLIQYQHSCPSIRGEWIPTATAMGGSSQEEWEDIQCVRLRFERKPRSERRE